MFIVKLADFNLLYWQNSFDYNARAYVHRDIPPKTLVSPCNSTKSLGVIIDIGPTVDALGINGQTRPRVDEVTVLWLTSKKKGKTEIKKAKDLTNYDAYKNHVRLYLNKLDEMEAEAAQTGM